MAQALSWLMRFAPASLGLFYTVDQRLLKFRTGTVVVRRRGVHSQELAPALERYCQHHHALDPFAPRRFASHRLTVVDLTDVGDERALALSAYVGEFLGGLGMSGQTTLHLRAHGQIVAGVDLLRARTDLPVSRQQLAFLRSSQPFLEQAYVCALGLPPATPPGGVVARVQLTRRELEVAELVASGASNAEIAYALGITPATVKSHLVHVFEKLNVRSRTQLAVTFNADPLAGAHPPAPLAPAGC
jgi:DNA-binding CsgD family transcriptional regulator